MLFESNPRQAASAIRDEANQVTGPASGGESPAFEALRESEERLRLREQELAAELAAMQRLHQISVLLIQEDRIDPIYEHILDAAIALMGSACASIQQFDRRRGELKLLAWRGFHTDSAQLWDWVAINSGSACAVALKRGERIVVPDVETCEWMRGTHDLDGYRKSGIRAVLSTPLLSRAGELVGMISTHWPQQHEPSERELRFLDMLARQAADVIERAQTNAAVQTQAAMLDALMEYVPEGITIASAPDVTIERVSAHGLRRIQQPAQTVTGISAEEHPRAWQVFDAAGQKQLSADELPLTRATRCGEIVENEELNLRLPDGTMLPILCNAGPIRGHDGQITGGVIAWRDIVELKRRDDHLKLIMSEVSHRSKNILAVVQAMVRQTARHAEDFETFQEELSQRIEALGSAHDLLLSHNWEGAPLRDLIQRQLEPFVGAGGDRVVLDGPDVGTTASAAQNLALAIHELCTNSCKYGALSTRNGQVNVLWAAAPGDSGRQRFSLKWIENGGPAVSVPERRGFGSFVLEKMVSVGLDGQARIDYEPGGIVWIIESESASFLRGGAE